MIEATLALGVVWTASAVRPETRSVRFVGALFAWSALYVALVALLGHTNLSTGVFLLGWVIAWSIPSLVGLGPIKRIEEQFDRELTPILSQLRAIPARAEATELRLRLAALRPPDADWTRVRDLLIDHVDDQLAHLNPAFIPDRWRIVRAEHLRDQIRSRRVLFAKQGASADAFDAELAELLAEIRPALRDVADAVRAGDPGSAGTPARRIADAQRVVGRIRDLTPPTDRWRDVVITLVPLLEEDIQAALDGRTGERTAEDVRARDLQRLWHQARVDRKGH